MFAMTPIYSTQTTDALREFQIELDGETLFNTNSRGEHLTCMIVCGVTRLGGLAFLLLAGYLVITRGDAILALNVAMFGMVLLLSGLIGLRGFQEQPRRLILDGEALRYVDPWSGVAREFPRQGCVTVRCGETDGRCALYVLHDDNRMDLLVDNLPREIVPTMVSALNEHLCAEAAAETLPCAQRSSNGRS
jgi:hypothetical protein